MTPFVVTNFEGIVVRSGRLANPADIDIQPLGPGESITSGVSGRAWKDRLDATGQVVPLPKVEPTLAEQKAALLARLAERRWEIEVSGIEVSGVRIPTDDRSKFMLSEAARDAEDHPITGWKTGAGQWVDMDSATIIAAAMAVRARVRTLFIRERQLSDQIVAASEITPALKSAVEDFWPI